MHTLASRLLLPLALVSLTLSGPARPGDGAAHGAPGHGTPGHGARRERVETHDNLDPAGALRDGVLALGLEVRVGTWHPDGEDAPGALVPAFAEVGGPLRIPGPLIRVPAGTEVVARVRNALPGDTLSVHGLFARPAAGAAANAATGAGGDADAGVRLPPGAARELRFRLEAPGTYYYWGTTSGRPFAARTGADAQLSGAIVVDEPGAAAGGDRVLVIGQWSDTTVAAAAELRRPLKRLLLVVNGRAWPHTTRLAYALGDTVRWRVVNAGADLHPMHLHGFFFSVDARGDDVADTLYAASRRELAVTDRLLPGRTMRLTWVPERAGNWLFHCHTPAHFARRGPLGATLDPAAREHPQHAENHAREGMNGLVVGVTVADRRAPRAPRAPQAATGTTARRRMRLLVRPNAGGTTAQPIYGYALHEGEGPEPPPDSGVRAGPTIVLERGVPVSITVVNRTPEQTAVHWHGMELESYFDGVPGFSGSDARPSPAIAPGDSFEARFTPPRAGTFIYHTHVDELRQQPAGLSGALLVVEPGRPYDPATDAVVLLTTPRDPAVAAEHVLVNGLLDPPPLAVRVGVPHRLRIVNITVGRPGTRVELRRDTVVAAWRVVAKDGADRSPAARAFRPARQPVAIGETYDVEFTPPAAGDYALEAWTANGRKRIARLPLRATAVERRP